MQLGVPQTIFFSKDRSKKAEQITFSFFTEKTYRETSLLINLVINKDYLGDGYHGVIDHILQTYCNSIHFDEVRILGINKRANGAWEVSKYCLIPNLNYFIKYQMQRTFFQRLFGQYPEPKDVNLYPIECIIGYVQSAVQLDISFSVNDNEIQDILKKSGFDDIELERVVVQNN